MRKFLLLNVLAILLFTLNLMAGTTGKLTGVVKDATTGEPLAGVNVMLEGTAIGAATNYDGYFVILNIPPGTYTVKASFIGYSTVIIKDVRIIIDQTTTIDIDMQDTSFQTGEVVVVATKPIVQKDVSSSRVSLDIKEIQNMPVVSAASVIGLQAGIQGLKVRGSSEDQTSFMVNGINLKDERDNTPFTAISFTSIQEIQVQTGGFNAEFGNIRAGLVNVVTKEGDKSKYSFTFLGRYSAPGQKHFGDSPNSYDSYWIRPYLDDAVCWTGTKNGNWDAYTQAQYQEFRGWNKVSQELLSDNNPNNDLTPEAAQRLFLFQHRREVDITKPDYDFDMSFSGPVPVVSSYLGDLRFAASFRGTKEMYLIPLSRDSYEDRTVQLKLTSDIQPGMKLSVEGLTGYQKGTNSSRSGGPGLFRSPSGIASEMDIRSGASYLDSRVFATDYWGPSQIDRHAFGIKFTHVLTPTTYYEINLNQVGSKYDTNPGRKRDTSKVYQFANMRVDEAPFGVYSGTSAGIGSSMNMGLGFSNSRDTSKVTTYSARFDLVSQLDKYNNIKTGLEFVYTDNNVNYALVEPSLPSNNTQSKWHTFPVRGALYIQDKLEFEGMIANIGLRLDYSHAGGEWYVFDPYNRALSGALSKGIDTLLRKESTEKIINLSPRIGIAFPITVDSKLYFNYGHFRSMPAPEDLYLLRRSQVNNSIVRIADPNNPLPKTVAYELGYEQNLFDQFLLRIAGYYKDVSDQTRLVTYTSRDNSVSYSIPKPYNYQDIRGFEITATKNRGLWVQGFINYTYEVVTGGNFGLPSYNENPTTQREIERTTSNFKQTKPTPRPYARANIDFFTPADFGPEVFGVKLLEDWRLNFVIAWKAGTYFSWTGPGGTMPGYENNIQWKDYYNVDMRLSKAFRFKGLSVELFMDMTNVFNHKYMDYRAGFADAKDFDAYMKSLHLPDNIAGKFNYGNIPGNDQPGDYRKGPYIPWDDNASEAQKDEWRKNKSYIDMPNLSYLTFLNPRNIYWGLRLTVDFN